MRTRISSGSQSGRADTWTSLPFPGHKSSDELAYIRRINLDQSNPDHRITLLTPDGCEGGKCSGSGGTRLLRIYFPR